jgi:ABC-2 type transport system permease protein
MLRRIITRTSAFLVKESVVALGQPRLILSLVVGPFLLLFLFGLGFSGRREPFDVALVVPDRATVPTSVDVYRDFFLWSLRLVHVTTDENEAFARLRERDVDVVVVAPPDPLRELAADEPATFAVYYNHLNPVDRSRINAVAYGHTRELNALLVAAILDGLIEASGVRERNETALDELRGRMLAGDSDGALGVIDRLLASVVILRVAGEEAYALTQSDATRPPTTPPLERFELLLRAIRAQVSPAPGLTVEQEAQLGELERTAALLPDVIGAAARVSPRRLAAPFDYALANIAPVETSYVRYFAPVVVALLLQHVAVTLASLSTVRERTRGTVELFAVAPVRLSEILIGKALSFATILGGLAVMLLLLLVFVLDVPLLGNVLMAALIVALLVAVSLAIGFILAAVSTTESQTVQLAMLVLLFAIFFGGWVVPLSSLDMPFRAIAYAVPVTHAGEALRAVMLRGSLVPLSSVGALALMALVLGPIATLLMRRSYRMW